MNRKSRRLVCSPGGGLVDEEIPEREQDLPVLSDGDLSSLVAYGLEIERLEGAPQDIEWALDPQGAFWILQTRPLRLSLRSVPAPTWEAGTREVLLHGGFVTSKGKATGKVLLVRRRQDLERLPGEPVILVMHQSLVDAVRVLGEAQGILVDLGNPADHLSCVAREYGKPMVAGLVEATKVLKDGQWITIDADQGRVLAALQDEVEESLLAKRPSKGRIIQQEERPLSPVLEALRDLIVKLNLTDAYGPTFSIMECHSIHDIIRYVHEKALLAMFEAGDEVFEGTSGVVFRLKAEIPFLLNIIDLGGGLAPDSRRGSVVSPEEVISRPFKALWQGISTPGLRWSTPPPVLGAISPVVSRWITDQRSERPIGLPNYVIVTRDYLNLNARMDFHFTMIDSVCGLDPRTNYVRFRFKGGGTSLKQRQRRALSIAEVLEWADFFTDLKDDLVNAHFGGAPASVIEEKLIALGRLLGFSRLLDAAMRDDNTPHLVAQAFQEGDYQLTRLQKDQAEGGRAAQA